MTGLYREQVYAPLWARGTLLTAFTMTVGLYVVQSLTGTMLGRNPAPNEVLLTLSILFGGIYLFFHKLRIELNHHGVQLSYGLMRRSIPYMDIERVELSRIGMVDYGGIGLEKNSRGDDAYSVRKGEAIKLVTRNKGPVLFTPPRKRGKNRLFYYQSEYCGLMKKSMLSILVS